MQKPYGCRIRIVSAEDQSHCWTIDGETAQQLVAKGVATPVANEFQAFIKVIALRVSVSELRDHMLWLHRPRRPKLQLRAPDSSTGGGDQGLAPLVGRLRSLHIPAHRAKIPDAVPASLKPSIKGCPDSASG